MEILNEKLASSSVHQKALLVDAMRAIDTGAAGIALVVDDCQRLVGLLTDGDIRRALLGGANLSSPVLPFMNRRFTAVSREDGRAHVLDLMQARHISQIPVLDGDGKLIGLHLLREILGSVSRDSWAVVMAGGKGTRLRPITETLPKPMIKVAGRPILERLVLHLVGFGITRIFLSINYLGHMIEEHFHDGSQFGCCIEYLRETSEMGTGGALSLLPERPTSPVVVLNGDLVTQINIHRLLEFHEKGEHVATMAVRRYFHQVPFGCVEVANQRVRKLDEKPMFQQLINAGTYVLAPEILDRIPAEFFPMTSLIETCLNRKESVGAWEIEEDWLDVGQREQLKVAQEGVA